MAKEFIDFVKPALFLEFVFDSFARSDYSRLYSLTQEESSFFALDPCVMEVLSRGLTNDRLPFSKGGHFLSVPVDGIASILF